MKLLIDTNIILDVLCKREGLYEGSAKIFKLCELRQMEGIISALSIPNIVYIMRKELDGDRNRDILEILSIIFRISDLKADDLKKAAEMNFRDYEDALQNVCAERMKADYIITRNKRDFAGSKVPAFSPEEFLEIDAPVNTC